MDKPAGSSKPIRKIPCLVYSRVVGYLRPVQFWVESKQEEFKDRVTYKMQEEKEKENKH